MLRRLDQAPAAFEAGLDLGFLPFANSGTPEHLALGPCPGESRMHALLDHRALELGEHAHHLE
jgi:hypothetical protein